MDTGVEYAISTVKDVDADSLTWQSDNCFAGLSEYTTYYVYGRIKETANTKAGAMSTALDVVTPLSNPYRIDAGKLNDSRYVGALVDSDGNSTVKVTQNDGIISASFTQNKDYTITGTGEDVAFDTGNTSGVTISGANIKKITVRPGNGGAFVINVCGNNIVDEGITCIKDEANTADVKLVGKTSPAGISSSESGSAAIKAGGNLEISGIQIRSEGKGIAAGGTVKISGGSNRIDAVSSAISASDVEMTGGTMEATSTGLTEDESVISADSTIKLVGGSITADASGSAGGNSFGVKSADGTIIVDGNAAIGGEPTYSKDPVDSNGDSVIMVKVTFVDEKGSQLYVASVNKGSSLDLSKVKITMSDGTDYQTFREGYSLSWKDDAGDVYGADGIYGTVNGDITLHAEWTWIVVDISSAASITYKTTGNSTYRTTYTGGKIAPSISVVLNDVELVKDTDYTVSYQNNVNAGTAKAVVKGKDRYKGTVTLTFTIAKRDVSKAKVTVATSVIYTGKTVKPSVKVVYGKTKLAVGKNYRVTYSLNKNFGRAKVVISGIGNYSGRVVRYFNIVTKKGKIYTCGNYKYKITNPSLNGKGTVTLVAPIKRLTSVSVPDTIKLGGKTFKVTAIGSGAFKGNTKLTKVVIGKNVRTIGSRAFYGCKNLKYVTIKNTQMTGKTVGASAFTGTYAKMTVKVPAKKLKSYKTILLKRGVSKKAVIKK